MIYLSPVIFIKIYYSGKPEFHISLNIFTGYLGIRISWTAVWWNTLDMPSSRNAWKYYVWTLKRWSTAGISDFPLISSRESISTSLHWIWSFLLLLVLVNWVPYRDSCASSLSSLKVLCAWFLYTKFLWFIHFRPFRAYLGCWCAILS